MNIYHLPELKKKTLRVTENIISSTYTVYGTSLQPVGDQKFNTPIYGNCFKGVQLTGYLKLLIIKIKFK